MVPPGPFPKPQWSSVCVGWMALLAAAATCPVGHLCYYVMAQICSADREALEKEGAQMAVCCHHRYSLRCSLLRSGELRERVMPRTGLRGVLRCQQPPSSLRLSQGPRILPEHGPYTRLCSANVQRARWFWEVQHTLRPYTICISSMCIMQWGRRCSLPFPDTEKMLGVCLARTVRHHKTGVRLGWGTRRVKDLKT